MAALGAALGVTAAGFGILILGALSWGIVIGTAIKDWENFIQTWLLAWEILKKGLDSVWSLIKTAIEEVYNWVKDNMKEIGNVILRAMPGIVQNLVTIISLITKALGLQDKLDKKSSKSRNRSSRNRSNNRSHPGRSGRSIRAPSWSPMPKGRPIMGLASGGIVTRPTFAMVGESGPEAVIPLNKSAGFGGVTINVQGKFCRIRG